MAKQSIYKTVNYINGKNYTVIINHQSSPKIIIKDSNRSFEKQLIQKLPMIENSEWFVKNKDTLYLDCYGGLFRVVFMAIWDCLQDLSWVYKEIIEYNVKDGAFVVIFRNTLDTVEIDVISKMDVFLAEINATTKALGVRTRFFGDDNKLSIFSDIESFPYILKTINQYVMLLEFFSDYFFLKNS